MSKPRWEARAAKRNMAEHAIREATRQIELMGESRTTQHASPYGYRVALHLIRQAADFLRQTEGQ